MVAVPKADEPRRVLDDEGAIVPGTNVPEIPAEDLVRIHTTMLLTRRMDERMMQLQRQGRIGFYVPSTGEEATHLAVQPLRPSDWIFPGYRDQGAWFWRGHDVASYVHQLFGNAADPAKGRQIPTHHTSRPTGMVSVSAPPGTQLPQAVGAAYAARLQRTGDVVMAFFGDGAATTGDFHAGMNFAAVYQAPVVFVCRSRGPAATAPAAQHAASARFAARGQGYGVPVVRVDGGDVLAVVQAATEAVARARAGEGPSLIEARVDAGNDTRVDAGMGRAAKADPVQRLSLYLQRRGLMSAELEAEIVRQHDQAIDEALGQAAATGAPVVDSLFDDVYEALPWHLDEQRRYLLAQERIAPRGS
jgi:2-oxoisovalerate dehydrogenase E1 component alpha subunit